MRHRRKGVPSAAGFPSTTGHFRDVGLLMVTLTGTTEFVDEWNGKDGLRLISDTRGRAEHPSIISHRQQPRARQHQLRLRPDEQAITAGVAGSFSSMTATSRNLRKVAECPDQFLEELSVEASDCDHLDQRGSGPCARYEFRPLAPCVDAGGSMTQSIGSGLDPCSGPQLPYICVTAAKSLYDIIQKA